MWIRALEVFKVEGADPSTWQDLFANFPLNDPVASQRKTFGFVAGHDSDKIVDELDGRYAFLTVLASRHLPAESVDRELTRRRKEAGETEALTEQQRDAMWEQVEADMLPHAPIREIRTPAVYCSKTDLLYVFGANKQGVEAMQQSVRAALGSFVAIPVRPRARVPEMTTGWLRGEEMPDFLGLGDSMVLNVDEEGASTTFRKQDLLSDEVVQHLDSGSTVKRISLAWREKLHFELDEKGGLSKIGPPGCKMKPQLAFIHWPEIMSDLPEFAEDMLKLMEADFLADEAADDQVADDAEPDAPQDQPACEESQSGDAQPDQGNQTDLRDQAGEPANDTQRAAEQFVPVVLPRLEAPQAEVERMLNALHTHKPMSGIIVVQRPVDSYRNVYIWAAERSVPITLMSMPDSLDTAALQLPQLATAAVHVDVGEPGDEDDDLVTRSIVEQAVERGVQVIKMRQPAE